MWQLLKRTWWAGLLAVGVQSAPAFSLLGPFDTWQVSQLSYNTRFDDFNEGPAGYSDPPVGGPMNLGEEFRWNIPVLNYAVDQSFLDFFGAKGVAALEQAVAILNSLTNVDSYSANLAEVPEAATRINYRAQALGLLDLKSATLHALVEQLGLADPVRYTWCLRGRALLPGAACPVYDYLVIKRNFDPLTWEPTTYVNGTLYTYRIAEFCPVVDQAEAFEHRVDPLQTFYTAVASPGVFDGAFFTGLTRDDVGGLRYLLRTNNVNREDAPLGTTLLSGGLPDTTARQLLSTSNLATLVFESFTNAPAVLVTRFPGLLLASTNAVTYTNVVQTNVFAYFTNPPTAPAYVFYLVLATNYSTNIEPRYHVTFANVRTNQYFTNGPVTTQDISVSPAPFAPPLSGLLATNIQTSTEIVSFVNGDYYLVPQGICDYRIVSTQLITMIPVTNTITVGTNVAGATNVNGQFFTRQTVSYFTNFTFVVDPIFCPSNAASAVAYQQGIGKVSFARQSYDSLLGQFFQPMTNTFSLNMVTNNQIYVRRFERPLVQPDILFSADDLVTAPTAWPIFVEPHSHGINHNTNNALPGLPGPGLIEPIKLLVFNKVGPTYENNGPVYLDEPSNVPSFVWGSFDGSTNPPVIYPSGTSIAAYEQSVLMEVTSSPLPNGNVGSFYSVQLEGSGGEAPYTWSLAPGSGPLPPGLGEFSAACGCWVVPADGGIYGTPTTAGTYSFTVRMTDNGARSVTRDLAIVIAP